MRPNESSLGEVWCEGEERSVMRIQDNPHQNPREKESVESGIDLLSRSSFRSVARSSEWMRLRDLRPMNEITPFLLLFSLF